MVIAEKNFPKRIRSSKLVKMCLFDKSSVHIIALYLISYIKLYHGLIFDDVCDRRPLGTKTAPLPPDNRFAIELVGIEDKYIPNHNYTIRLFSRDNVSSFIAFTISAKEDTKHNEDNPRRPINLSSGRIVLSPDSDDTIESPFCNNTIIQADITPKTSVQAIWWAPPKDQQCVTIYAVLAVKPGVWYNLEGPLSKRVCEDRRKADDMQPMENDDCQVCEEARYQLTFEGMWSYNTHPQMFPASKEMARFSDVVGASHSKNFYVYKYNADASLGMKMLAEQGNTTQLEVEIRDQLGSNVRTIIKASGPPKPNMSTVAVFRASREHHLVSLVSAIIPSPDWFLGVANFELCDVNTGNWAHSIRLNLYPMDAGTDSGMTFESPNEEASPSQPISSAIIAKDVPKEQIKPFARLHFDLIRTYITPDCSTNAPSTEETSEEPEPVEQPTTTTTEQPSTDPESTKDCPMTKWEEWLPCEGKCVDGQLSGFQMRFRYHMVNSVAVGKYVENGPSFNDKEVPEECLDIADSETQECNEECGEEETKAQRRIWRDTESRFKGGGRN